MRGKFWALLFCLYATTAAAMTGAEMDAAIASQTELPETKVKTTLDAFEARLKQEAAAGKAVKLEGFGTMMPRAVSGQRTGRTISGGTTTYPNWKLVKNPEVVKDADLYDPSMGVTRDEYSTILGQYKSNTKMVINRGGIYSSRGLGTFKMRRLAATKNKPARYTTAFSSGKTGMHQKFVQE